MKETEILEIIAQVARDKLDHNGALEAGMKLAEELDSLRLMTLAVEVENRFRIRLTEDDEAQIETVGDLVKTIWRRTRAGG